MSLLSEALNPIRIFGRQARSYVKPMGRLGVQLSREVASHATKGGLLMKAGIGAGVGAAGGAGYASTNDRVTARSMVRGGLIGAGIGALGGAGYGIGRSAYALRGSEAARNLGANARILGRDARRAYGATRSTWADVARYGAGVG